MRHLTAAATALRVIVVVAALLGVVVSRTQAQTSGPTTYTVQPGDDLYRIGLKFGLSADVLARANGIVNPNIVYVGQVLIIPAGAILPTGTPAPAQVPPPGVTLEATASANAEGAANPEATAANVEATAAIPEATVELPAVPTVTPTEVPTEVATEAAAPVAQVPTATPVPTTYTVQPGDNLYRIALKFNTTVQVLVQLNGLPNSNIVYVGEVLKLPAPPAVAAVPGAPAAAPTAAPANPQATAAPQGTPTNEASNIGFSYGITTLLSSSDPAPVVNAVKTLGLTWVRLPVLWKTIEATKGSPTFQALDASVNALNAAGFKILLTVSAAPDWARPVNTESGPPTDFADYASFVGTLATQYKGKIQAFEIWDEPNIRLEWSGRPLSAASYVEMLRVAYTSIKQVDPSILVISAGLSPTGFNDGVNAINDRTFLRQEYAAGLASYSDAVGAHPSGWANPPDSTCCNASPGVTGWFNDRSFYFRDTLKDYRDIMIQNGGSGQFIWITQFGWGSSEGVVTDPNTVDPNYGFVKFVSQAQQAAYVTRAFEVGRVLGYIGPMFAYNLNACTVAGNEPTSPDFRACYFSLENADASPRPAFGALQAVQK